MAYIGRGIDKLSNIEKLDVITFDGSSSYSLTKNSVAFTPSSANSLQVSIDGVVQAGNFTVSGSTIDFGTAVASTSTNDFIFHYGTGLITTPADGTVTTGKIQDGAVTAAKLDSGVALGKVLQVQTVNDNTQTAAGSSGGVEITELELSITPSSTSSKILVSLNLGLIGADSAADLGVQIKRTIGSGSASILQAGSSGTTCTFVPVMSAIGGNSAFSGSHTLIDSPSTTSACKYEVFINVNSGRTFSLNRRHADTTFSSSSSMHLLEIGG